MKEGDDRATVVLKAASLKSLQALLSVNHDAQAALLERGAAGSAALAAARARALATALSLPER